MNDPILSAIGLARRAGKLAPGFSAACGSLRRKHSFLIVVASDISAKTEKELRFFSGGTEVLRVPYTIFDITCAIGTKAGVVSIDDEGLAKKILNLLHES